MGVSGSGKSTIGEELGRRLGWPYEDADAFHPATNIAKLRAGHPLTDDDRRPWLQAVAHEIERVCRTRGHIVMACSALKRSYRLILSQGEPNIRFIYLDGTRELIAKRLSGRHHSFMPAELLKSQFDVLEAPGADENPVIASIDAPVHRIVSEIIEKLGLGSDTAGAARNRL